MTDSFACLNRLCRPARWPLACLRIFLRRRLVWLLPRTRGISALLRVVGHQLADALGVIFGHRELAAEQPQRAAPLFAAGVVNLALTAHDLAPAGEVETNTGRPTLA